MDGKKCPRCGYQNLTSKNTCDNCGSILPLGENEIICPRCGRIVNKSASYCSFCGFPIKVMGNTRFLLKQIKEAERSYKSVLEMTKDRKDFINKLCHILSAKYKRDKNEFEDCLKNAKIKIEERGKNQYGIRIYPIAILVQDDKWDKFCEFCNASGSEGFNIPIEEPPFRGLGGVSFVKHSNEDTGTLWHEFKHSSFRLYHSRSTEKHEKELHASILSETLLEKPSDTKYIFESPKTKYISHRLLSELDSWRSNVEKEKITWSEVYMQLAFGYLPLRLKVFPEIYNDIKDLSIEEMHEYSKTEKGQDFNSFLHLIWNACLAMEELEKRYDKWVIDRFMAKSDELRDVIYWEKQKDYLDKLQAREGKNPQQGFEKLDRTMEKLEGEILDEDKKELEKIEEEIREESKSKKIKKPSFLDREDEE